VLDRSRIGIVIPALNESQTIAAVVQAAARHGTPIVVDDGSSDETAAVADRAGAVVVSHPRNLGYDGALGSGFVKAAELGCEYVVTVDADGQHDPSIVDAFIRQLDAGADIVVGIRPSHARLAEAAFSWAATLRWGIRDPLCGLKAYRTTVWRQLGHFDSYGSIGTNLTLFAARQGMRIDQLPVPIRERTQGAPRFDSLLRANVRLFRAMLIGLWRWGF
jgi:glycosyltransferase involved in cell wall biosynthesis